MHTKIIKALKADGWHVTLHDVGVDGPALVMAVKLEDAIDLWYLSKACIKLDIEVGAVFMAANWVAYFPLLEADADDYREIMS